MSHEKLTEKVREVRTHVQRTVCSLELVMITRNEVIENNADDAEFVALEHTALEVIEFFAVRG